MTKHRYPPGSVSNDEPDHNPVPFDPAQALQGLHVEIIQLEAIANAASEAMAVLPFPEDREERRVYERAYALVSKFAEDTNALVRYGDELVAALAVHLNRRPAEGGSADEEPPPPSPRTPDANRTRR